MRFIVLLLLAFSVPLLAQEAPKKKTPKKVKATQAAHKKPTPEQIREFNAAQKKREQ